MTNLTPNITDCSPKPSEMLNQPDCPQAFVVAKKLIGTASDQNTYTVLCIWPRGNDNIRPWEYVIWTMYANENRYMVEGGRYFGHTPEDFVAAAEVFGKRG